MRRELDSKSIAELEGIQWPPPNPRAPRTFVRCYELRNKPLSELAAADWRLLIGQDVGLDLLMPLAIDAVEADPLTKTEHYQGDLLVAVLSASPMFFAKRPDLRGRIERVLATLPSALDAFDAIDYDTSSEALEEAAAYFQRGSRTG